MVMDMKAQQADALNQQNESNRKWVCYVAKCDRVTKMLHASAVVLNSRNWPEKMVPKIYVPPKPTLK